MAITDESVSKMKKVRDFIAETPATYSQLDLEDRRMTITVILSEDDAEFLEGLQRLLAPA